MLKKISLLFVCLILLTVNIGKACAATSEIMLNAEDGSIMYEQNADEKRYPASLTKLMTLYITFSALENGKLKLDDKLKVSRTAANRSPSKLGVKAGTTISVKDAIMALIVKSANDCATVLAEHFSKTEADFAVLMTSSAKKLGMKNTVFKNASGLPNSKQKTTARDMAILAMAVYHHYPQYYSWFALKSFKYKGQTISGHNHLLSTFAGADGMKTGYTAASGYNIITSAKRNNKRVIAVTMGHKYLNERDKKAAVMMDKGLNALKKSGKVDIVALTKAINGGSKAPVVVARNNIKAPIKSDRATMVAQKTATNGAYALQVGAFSEFKKARNYAISIKNSLAKKYNVYNIKVEPVKHNNKTIFRSKVVGLEKKDATQICQNMKKQNKPCMVVADSSNIKLAQK